MSPVLNFEQWMAATGDDGKTLSETMFPFQPYSDDKTGRQSYRWVVYLPTPFLPAWSIPLGVQIRTGDRWVNLLLSENLLLSPDIEDRRLAYHLGDIQALFRTCGPDVRTQGTLGAHVVVQGWHYLPVEWTDIDAVEWFKKGHEMFSWLPAGTWKLPADWQEPPDKSTRAAVDDEE